MKPLTTEPTDEKDEKQNGKSNIIAAKIAARIAFKPVQKSGRNSFDNYDYSTLADYLEAIEDSLQANRLDLTQEVIGRESYDSGFAKMSSGHLVEVLTTLTHAKSGETIQTVTPGDAWDKGDKSLWKAITGARKFAIQLLFNLYGEDDPEKDSLPKDAKRGAPQRPARTAPQQPAQTSGQGSTAQTSTATAAPQKGDQAPQRQGELPLGGIAEPAKPDPTVWDNWQPLIDRATSPNSLQALLKRAQEIPEVWADTTLRRRIFDGVQGKNEVGIRDENFPDWRDDTTTELDETLSNYLAELNKN